MGAGKAKKSIWLPEETWKLVESHREKDDHQTISGFIDQAVKYYCCSFETEAYKEILTKELTDAIKYNIRNSENHIAATLFKLAGEQATLNLLIADHLIGDLDDNVIRAYRNAAYDIVRKRHGVFSFEDAMEDARAIAESEDD